MQLRVFLIAVIAGITAACGGDSTGPDGLTPVATLSIADLPDTLLTRQSIRLTAFPAAEAGHILAGRPLAWASSDPAVVSITDGGVLTALTPGVATVRVSTGAVTDSASVTVRTLALAHVFTGDAVSCGLEATGEVWCWGSVGAAGYGNGSFDTTRTLVPSRAARGHTFSTLAISPTSACGVELSGSVVCWGANDHGQLGDGSTTARAAPVAVPGVSNAVQVVAGDAHYCARSSAGAVTCWGSNESKQAGQAQRALATAPHGVDPGGAATDLAAGADFTCALVAGQDKCWGADGFRQLGSDTNYDRLAPVQAGTGDGVSRVWLDVGANYLHTCGRESGGGTYCWGFLRAGNDNDTTAWTPFRLFPGMDAAALGVGPHPACIVTLAHEAWCQVWNFPPTEISWPQPATLIAAADDGGCVVDESGNVGCVAHGTFPIPLPAPVRQLAGSDFGTCAQDTNMAVYCWDLASGSPVPFRIFDSWSITGIFTGSGSRVCGLAGGTSVICRETVPNSAETVDASGQSLVLLAVGDHHTCGLTATGTAWCWGQNDHGQLGDGTTTDRPAPVQVQGGHLFVQLAAGFAHTCGRTSGGELWCWGQGRYGQMGDDHRDESATPVTVAGAPSLDAVSGTCALSAGSAWCWSSADGTTGARQITGATGLAGLGSAGQAWYQHSCGLRASGELLCWGSNDAGVFGNGTNGNTYANAVAAANGILFREVAQSSYATACGIGLDGATYCWGNGYSTVPVKMLGS